MNNPYVWYIGPFMEHYRYHKAYIPKSRAEKISDTVEIPPTKFNMPNIYFTDATIHVSQYLIHALHNPEHVSPIFALVNAHKEELISLADIL